MRMFLVLIIFFFEISMQNCFGQEFIGKYSNNKLDIDALIQKAHKGDNSAILKIGREGDESLIPTLKLIKQSSSNRNFGSVYCNAQMAMAKLGDKESMAEIVAELDNDDPMFQNHAIAKLAYVGNAKAIEMLLSLLRNDSPRTMKGYDPSNRGPDGELPQGKIIYLPVNIIAMKALAEIIPNPIVTLGKEPTQIEIKQWLEWWKENNVIQQMEYKNVYELLELIKQRPDEYLRDKSLFDLEICLRGYMACLHAHKIIENYDFKKFDNSGFAKWLKQKYGWHWSMGWANAIVEHSEDNDDAFKRFYNLLELYKNDIVKANSKPVNQHTQKSKRKLNK